MHLVNTEGIVIKASDYGEYDRLYLIFTKDLGKILARVHGVRRSKNLVAGHLSPFLPASLLLLSRQDFFTLKEAESLDHYNKIGYQAVARLHLVAELVDKLTVYNEADSGLYDVLRYVSQLLTSDQWWQLSFAEILAKVIAVLGVAPSTRRCVITGTKIDPTQPIYWSAVYGGVVQAPDRRLGDDDSFYQIKDTSTLKLLKVLMDRGPVAHRLRVGETIAQEAEYLLLDYMQIYVQQNLRALPFIRSQP